jgi:hypothetical protein
MDLAARAGVGRGRGWERPVGELEEGSGGTPARARELPAHQAPYPLLPV